MGKNKILLLIFSFVVCSINTQARDFTALDFSDAIGMYSGNFQLSHKTSSCTYTYTNYVHDLKLISVEYYCGFQTNVYTFKKSFSTKRHLGLTTALKKGTCSDLSLDLNYDQSITMQNNCTGVSVKLTRVK